MTLKKNHKYISGELFETTKLSELKKLSAKELLDLGKIEYPLYKSTEDETYSLISYERASELIARRIKQSNPEPQILKRHWLSNFKLFGFGFIFICLVTLIFFLYVNN